MTVATKAYNAYYCQVPYIFRVLLEVKGSMMAQVCYGDEEANLSLLVVKDGGPSLLGRDWLQHLKLDW